MARAVTDQQRRGIVRAFAAHRVDCNLLRAVPVLAALLCLHGSMAIVWRRRRMGGAAAPRTVE